MNDEKHLRLLAETYTLSQKVLMMNSGNVLSVLERIGIQPVSTVQMTVLNGWKKKKKKKTFQFVEGRWHIMHCDLVLKVTKRDPRVSNFCVFVEKYATDSIMMQTLRD